MLKYTDSLVTFSEVPDEVTLCIDISNCPYHCPGCHSKELWGDIGEWLSVGKLVDLVNKNEGITCVCFMGGDSDLEELYNLFKFIPMLFKHLKIAWYTGRSSIPEDVPDCLDYIKIGPYKEECGPINKKTTNQKFYCRDSENKFQDITYKFWKNDSNS